MSEIRRFRVSSFCSGGACVAVADDGHAISVANSADADVAVRFTYDEWSAFLSGVKAGEFDVD